MDALALRVTPLTVLEDVETMAARYAALGFRRINTGDAGCVGMQAGGTSILLVTHASLGRDFDPALVGRLTGRTIAYIHVASVEEARLRLPSTARVLQDVRTRGGTRELLVEDGGEHFLLAERTEDA